MKYTITGSLGNISKPIVIALVQAGHDITVITSSTKRIKEIETLGAKAAVGSVEDVDFLKQTFSGADTVYTMVPPSFPATDWKGHIGKIGENYAKAINGSNIKHVVNLSSIGAHMPDGCGPVSGIHRTEVALNALTGVNIKHLRPAYFYFNLLSNINLIKNAGIMGSNFSYSDKKFTIVHPDDIAAVAIPFLLQPDFTGHTIEYVVSDLVSTNDIASTIGSAIGKPDLKWVEFTDDQALQGGIQAGLPEEVSKNYAEMGHAIRTGQMAEEYWKENPGVSGKIKLADFAKIFAKVYNGEAELAAH